MEAKNYEENEVVSVPLPEVDLHCPHVWDFDTSAKFDLGSGIQLTLLTYVCKNCGGVISRELEEEDIQQ